MDCILRRKQKPFLQEHKLPRGPLYRLAYEWVLGPRLVHGLVHGADRLVEPHEEPFPDQEMADVELDDLRDRRHGGDALEGETVASMDLEADLRSRFRGAAQAREFMGRARLVARIEGLAIGARVELHHRRAEAVGRPHGVDLRLDEERDPDPGLLQRFDRMAQVRP